MATTETITHKNGKVGGYLIGRRHNNGGIKAVNVDNDAPLEVESDEVIITRRAVLSNQKHEFNGKQMTNLEILSTINEQGGGVSLMEQGGRMGENYSCKCCGKRHKYMGQDLTDREILDKMNKKMEEGGHICGCNEGYYKLSISYPVNNLSTSDESSEAIKQRMISQINSLKFAILFVATSEAEILHNQLNALLIQYKCFNYG